MKDKVLKYFKELIPYVIIIVAVILIRTFIVTPVRVDGNSMNPTFEDGNILILNKFDHKYDRFEIIVFRYNNKKLVKRVIGLPGDTVEIKDNTLYINGEIMEEDFEHLHTKDFSLSEIGYDTIPEDMYFVLGDNRSNSLDSRFLGLVSKDIIEGVVGFSIIPFKSIK